MGRGDVATLRAIAEAIKRRRPDAQFPLRLVRGELWLARIPVREATLSAVEEAAAAARALSLGLIEDVRASLRIEGDRYVVDLYARLGEEQRRRFYA